MRGYQVYLDGKYIGTEEQVRICLMGGSVLMYWEAAITIIRVLPLF
jgi:hypothetical protein